MKGRKWVKDELFVPLLSWRYWPRKPGKLCKACRKKANTLTNWTPRKVRALKKHRSRGCGGLKLVPIMVVMHRLQRGAGKSTNFSAVIAALMAGIEGYEVGFVASAGKQTAQIVEENFKTPILSSKRLAKRFRFKGDKVIFPRPAGRSSFMEFVESSHRSAPGRRRDLVYFDEARTIHGRTFFAFVMSIKGKSRFECPHGHPSIHFKDREHDAPKCPICGEDMWPRIPKILISSSAGLLEGDDYEWFEEVVERELESPHPHVHVYDNAKADNPAIADVEMEVLTTVFGNVKSLATYADIELYNRARRKGEDFVSVLQIDAIMARSLDWLGGSLAPGYGFLDTSTTKELTSLVLVLDDIDLGAPLWQNIRLARADFWEPKKMKNGHIDPGVIQAHLDAVMPMFPNLKRLDVDVRGGLVWALDLVEFCRANRPSWGNRVHGYTAKGKEERERRVHSWILFEHRIVAGTYRQPHHDVMVDELKGVRRVPLPDGKGYEVRDRSRKKQHADLIEGVATCCYRIFEEQTKKTISMAQVMGGGAIDQALTRLYKPMTASLKPGRI